MASNRLVWYVLVDGEGEAYKGTTASSVDIPSNYVIEQFKKTVKAENPNVLANFDRPQLEVYENKDAFNGKDGPLGGRDKIGEQLGSEDELYVVVPALDAVRYQKILNKLEKMEQDLREIKRPRSKRSINGYLARQALERKKSFVALEDKEGGMAIWCATEQEIVSAIAIESELVEFVTPYLANILKDSELVFVNSEKSPWLRQHIDTRSGTICKPDGFATHAGMYRKKEDKIRFGTMEPKLMDCMMIIEAKLNISDDSFGEVISYLEFVKDVLVDENCCFCPLVATPALLFDRQGFWLISSIRGTPIHVETMKWTQPGSKDALTNFVRNEIPIWIPLLIDACGKHGVSVVEGASFLGSGAFSRVFQVMSQTDMEPLALKIVPNKSGGGAPSLHTERQRLEEAAESHVAAVTPVGDCKILLDGLARSLLLKPVGSPISRSELRNVQVLRSIFDALCQLHQAQCEHGDARVENLIRHKQKLLWVDFMSFSPASSLPLDQELIKRDTEFLVRSVLDLSHNSVLPQTVQPLVHQYINDPTAETARALANSVHTVG
jgi:hypothetical protein